MSSGNIFRREHQFQLWVVYAIEMHSMNEKFQRDSLPIAKNNQAWNWFSCPEILPEDIVDLKEDEWENGK